MDGKDMNNFKDLNKSLHSATQLKQLNEKIIGLGVIIDESSKESSKLQKTLNFWTKVMAGAVAIQAILILIQLIK